MNLTASSFDSTVLCVCTKNNDKNITWLKKRCIFRLVGYEGSFMVNLSLDFRTYQGNGVILYHKFRNIHSFILPSRHPTIYQCSPKKSYRRIARPPRWTAQSHLKPTVPPNFSIFLLTYEPTFLENSFMAFVFYKFILPWWFW